MSSGDEITTVSLVGIAENADTHWTCGQAREVASPRGRMPI